MTPSQWIKLFFLRDEFVLSEKIKSVIRDTKERIEKHFARSENDGFFPPKNNESLEWIKEIGRNELLNLERQLRKLRMDRKFRGKPSIEGIVTPEMIERAKQHPIENLIEVNRQGFTKCFGHSDKKPSAYCKKNFMFCFVCNKSWDTIAVLMERDSLTFKDAVNKLQ